MSDSEFSDKKILQSWHSNAAPWIRAIEGATIASRKLVTDAAIVAAALAQRPRSALDLGCGEGWLSRQLAACGIGVLGIDAVPDLIGSAQERAGPGERYRQLSYAALAAGALRERFDLLVANFSLLGRESVVEIFAVAPTLLNPGGQLLVQTLHPLMSCGGAEYRDGWRAGTRDGFGEEFSHPAPWYFRTLESWLALYCGNGLELVGIQEPLHPHTGKPASLILRGRVPRR